jgi:hypothetical protein
VEEGEKKVSISFLKERNKELFLVAAASLASFLSAARLNIIFWFFF